MSSDDQTVGQQQPPERPASNIDAERDAAHDPLAKITTEPGDRIAGADSIDLLVIEAEIACNGTALDNPAKPLSEAIGEKLFERLDEHDEDLVPAWTRPWEDDE